MTKPHIKLSGLFLKVWRRSDEDFETRPCIAAPVCPSAAFRPKPDWRLNLVLSAGNMSSADAVPVLEPCSVESLDVILQAVIARTMACAGRMDGAGVVLPYNLCRYRSDAPGDEAERSEQRWARAILAPPGSPDSFTPGASPPSPRRAPPSYHSFQASSQGGSRPSLVRRMSSLSFGASPRRWSAGQPRYSNKYDWKMRPYLS